MAHTYVFKKKWKHGVAFIFDCLGKLATFWMPRNQPIEVSSLKKILLTRIDHLGDALLLRPLIFRLRSALPECEIHILTTPENAPIFKEDSFLDRILIFEDHWFQKSTSMNRQFRSFLNILKLIRKEKYDAAFDFRGDLRINFLFFLAGIPIRAGYGITGGGWMLTHERSWSSKKHQVELNADLLKDWVTFDKDMINPAVKYPLTTRARVVQKMRNAATPYAVVHPGAGNPLKEWPGNNFVDLIDRLLQWGRIKTFFLVGSVSEKNRFPVSARRGVVDLRGLTDLHEMACLLDDAAFFVGNDSGPAHLAAAQGIHTVVISSKTNDIRFWHPWTKSLSLLQADETGSISISRVEKAITELFVNEKSL